MVGKVVGGMSMSLDGFVCDARGDLRPLYPDMATIREAASVKESIRDTGAVVMGRRAYDLTPGADYTGYEYQVPIFVVTHRPPAKGPKGVNDRLTITFVTEGPAEAVRRAKLAAKGKDVTIVGGPSTLSQLIEAGLVDEIGISIVPVLLGDGLRLFGGLRDLPRLERTRVVESTARTDIVYRVVRKEHARRTKAPEQGRSRSGTRPSSRART